MKGNYFKGGFCSKAFTLIELLVVVLIIGILAAVAVPQYQKAVEKSHAAQALALLNTAYEHAVVYYMTNGSYPNSFEEMGMDVPWPATSSASLQWMQNIPKYLKETRSDGTWSFQLYQTETKEGLSIYMGPVKGKYAGAGFVVDIVGPNGALLNKNILCAERRKHGINFEGNPGDYCKKIIHGTYTTKDSKDSYRAYTLP